MIYWCICWCGILNLISTVFEEKHIYKNTCIMYSIEAAQMQFHRKLVVISKRGHITNYKRREARDSRQGGINTRPPDGLEGKCGPDRRLQVAQENTVIHHLTTGINSEKGVVRRFCHCANVIQCTYTNLDSTV